MPVISETIHLTLEDAAALLRDRRMSPLELTEACLARIEAVEPRLNAFVTVTADVARAQAREAGEEIAAGRYRGPLHGIPVAVKDLFATKGIRTTAGSGILADWIPTEDATVVRRLREAGAVLLGKLGLHEFAYGVSSVNPHFGDVHNPWDTTKIPGGSSGGSAVAVVAGEAYATLGSDTGGSIRIPASLCGCVGLKPTYGRASLFGAVPLAWSLDHPGPLARTVRDVALATTAIAGFDPRDPISADRPVPDFLAGIEAGPQKLRIGVPTDHVWDECDPAIATAVRAAIEALAQAGAEILEIRWPRAAEYAKASSAVLGVEARAYHEGAFPGRSAEYGPLIRTRLASQGDVDAETYARSMRLLLEVRGGAADSDLDGVDVLAMPTVPSRAWTIAEAKEIPRPSEWTRITRIFDLTGQPAISVPCGIDPDGMPIGLQFGARMWDEAAALRAARAYELVRGPFPSPPLDDYNSDGEKRGGGVDRRAGVEGAANKDHEKRDDARYQYEAAAAGHRPTVTRSLGSRGEVDRVTRDEAWDLLCKHTKSESLRKHGLAVEAAMRRFARANGENEETWAITGLLHDFDYERDPAGHPQNGKPILEQAGVPAPIVHAIQSHGDHTGVPRVTAMEKTLYAVDELCGFVTAVALVKPSKAVRDVDATSVRKKMKDKAFARAVSRDMMLKGAEDMGVPFDDLIAEVVRAMDDAADRLGLEGTTTT